MTASTLIVTIQKVLQSGANSQSPVLAAVPTITTNTIAATAPPSSFR